MLEKSDEAGCLTLQQKTVSSHPLSVGYFVNVVITSVFSISDKVLGPLTYLTVFMAYCK
jgi:hypothetical protein